MPGPRRAEVLAALSLAIDLGLGQLMEHMLRSALIATRLRLLAGGSANREISRRLSITEKTVRNHVEHIYAKIGVSNRTGAGLFALEHGIIGAFER